jgi:hypothetical protein
MRDPTEISRNQIRNAYAISSPNSVPKNKLNYILAHDFTQTTYNSDYFAPSILVVEFKLICSE